MSAAATTVSTHILDTALGRPAAGVPVWLELRRGGGAVSTAADGWQPHAEGRTDADGRWRDAPPLPDDAVHVRLRFDTGDYAARQVDTSDTRHEPQPPTAFFPEVSTVFAVAPGEHHHVPLLLSPFGYSVYRGS